jgi:hypothetical protein
MTAERRLGRRNARLARIRRVARGIRIAISRREDNTRVP